MSETERERNESGQYRETITLDAVLSVFDDVEGPVITSSDVAKALDCTTEAARIKLKRLEDRGQLKSRRTGRTSVYWVVESKSKPDYLKSFGKYAGTDMRESVEQVGEQMDRDFRERVDERP